MSEDANKHEKDEELEALLKKLVPAPLQFDLLAELHRDYERIADEETPVSDRVPWRRLIPLTLVSAIAMAGFGYVQFGERFAGTASPAEEAVAAVAPVTVPAREGGTQFVPVSAQGYLLNTSSGGVIQTDEGPRQRLNLEFEDAYHWHDPASGTNVRLFQPRSEEVIVPLRTD
jgi:hypothetical protein